MKCQPLLLTLLAACSLGIVGYIHTKRKDEAQLSKLMSFHNVKHRVTKDVMQEYQTHLVESTSLLDKTKKHIEGLKNEVSGAELAANGAKNELDTCNGNLKSLTDEAAAAETEKNKLNGEFEKKKTSLQEQMTNLKQEVEKRSKACDYIDKKSDEGKKLCGIEDPPKKEEKKDAKSEAPKQSA